MCCKLLKQVRWPRRAVPAPVLLELLVIPLDAPAELGLVDEVSQRRILRQGGEPIFGRLVLALRPLDQEPFLGPRCGAPIVSVRRPEAEGGESEASAALVPSRQVTVRQAVSGRVCASALAESGLCSRSRARARADGRFRSTALLVMARYRGGRRLAEDWMPTT